MQPPARYEIRVAGVLDAGWSAGPVADQAALHGVLAKVRDLGLTLIAVQRMPPD